MPQFGFNDEQKRKFMEDGCFIIEDFLSPKECNDLMAESSKLVDQMNPQDHQAIFSTDSHEQMKNDYLLSTIDKIGYFWEPEAIDEKGDLKLPKELALNKMGHAFHMDVEKFKKLTFDERVQTILRKLDFIKPVVTQSMYIFKPPKIGGEVSPHIDSTFLYSEPSKLIGFWIALEDATLENSCLQFVRGSHKTSKPTRRMVRNPVEGALPTLLFEGSIDFHPPADFEPAPVKRGSLVLIDGNVQHRSAKNTSDKSRHIYTFHVTETNNTIWSKRNWLQPTESMKEFPVIFDDSQVQ